MKNRVIKNFLMFVGFWMLITIGLNIYNQRAIFYNFPWEILLIFFLSLLLVITNLSKKAAIIIDFVVFYIYMLINGGYYNWTSLIIFAGSSAFMTAITYFISVQFKKGEHVK
ncbi:hypothetical protein [Companilactobacillus musae]|jgi:hypothetical protein|uniref:hypothetical protein n=1 Tax=Companilactobacillus musae TaxID=1903258 RepID=UPI000E656E1C|nr:hypothetical protein [Companilactobacillus musae]